MSDTQYQPLAEPLTFTPDPAPAQASVLPTFPIWRVASLALGSQSFGQVDEGVSFDMGWTPMILTADGKRWGTVPSGMTPPEKP